MKISRARVARNLMITVWLRSINMTEGQLMNFKSFNLHPRIESGITGLGYTTPTPIQSQCIPPILRGQDTIGLAQTGTGKTAAFVVPILQNLMDCQRKRIYALIVVPTRELAEQIHQSVMELGRHTKRKSITIYGGMKQVIQTRKLNAGAEIVVACPGRLIDLMNQNLIDLSFLKVLVLDEADRMFDMGFLPDIRKIMKQLPPDRQTLLFSATMPDDIRELAQDILRDPETVQIGHSAPVATVSHALYPVEPHLKTTLLLKLLDRTDIESVLVFTRTRIRATRLAKQMKKAGFSAASLQGDMSQNKRQAALSGFRGGTYQILVATDIAARGIDIANISHVINYDMPDTVDAYTHRIGRTGRAAKTGTAYTFVTREDRAIVWDIEKVLGDSIERRTLEDFDYNVAPPAGKSSLNLRQSRSRHNTLKSFDFSQTQPAFASSSVPAASGNHRNGTRSHAGGTKFSGSRHFKSRKSRSMR